MKGDREDEGIKVTQKRQRDGAFSPKSNYKRAVVWKNILSLSLRRHPSPTAELQDPGPVFPASCFSAHSPWSTIPVLSAGFFSSFLQLPLCLIHTRCQTRRCSSDDALPLALFPWML